MKKILNDNINTKEILEQGEEKRGLKTELVEVDELGNEVFLGSNKFVVYGQLFTLQKLFNVDTSIEIQYLNDLLGINTMTNDFTDSGVRREKSICLFGVGVDGADFAQDGVKEVDEKKRGIPVESMIPLRYPEVTNDLDPATQDKYAMRKVIGDRVAYYLKKFENTPTIKSRFVNGTPISSNVHNSTNEEDIETFIEIPISINKEELREYYIEEEGGVQFTYINTFGFYAGVYSESLDDYIFVNGVSKININNDHYDNLDKYTNLIYRIFIG